MNLFAWLMLRECGRTPPFVYTQMARPHDDWAWYVD